MKLRIVMDSLRKITLQYVGFDLNRKKPFVTGQKRDANGTEFDGNRLTLTAEN